HLAVGAFQAEIELADDIVARASKFGGTDERLVQTVQFVRDELQRFVEIIEVESSGNGERANVVEVAKRTVDGIRQAAVFADDVEQPRTHVLTKNGVEQAQRKPALVVTRTSADTEGDLRLFRRLGE